MSVLPCFLAEASPEDFFVPYVWSLVVSSLQIPWTLSAITAFVPMIPALPGGSDEAAQPIPATAWTPENLVSPRDSEAV